jgi:hypothetical protein
MPGRDGFSRKKGGDLAENLQSPYPDDCPDALTAPRLHDQRKIFGTNATNGGGRDGT